MKIDFKSDNIMNLYCLWLGAMGQNSDEVLSAFNDEAILKIKDAMPSNKFSSETFTSLKQLQAEIVDGNIKDIDGFCASIKEKFPNDAQRMIPAFKTSFKALSDFYGTTETRAEQIKAQGVLNEDQGKYLDLLNNMASFYGVEGKQNIPCYITIYPDKKFNDGQAYQDAFQVSYSLEKDKDGYANNTIVPVRKMSTPLHESSHYLLNRSPSYLNIKEGTCLSGMYKSLDRYFEQNPQEKQNGDSSLNAIHEAFAACATALYLQKVRGEPLAPGRTWYHGFEAANKLAPKIYPRFRDYVLNGKTIDDKFFEGLNIDLNQKTADNKRLAEATQKMGR